MPGPEGKPMASGREADVYLLDERRVLRRYRAGGDTAREAAVMAYLIDFDFPLPAVYSAAGTDLILERLDGPTMAQALLAGSLSLAEGAEILAGLLRRLHAVPARAGVGSIVHLDLHLENVVMTGRGPVVIDWPNAGDGPGDLDTALSALILAQVAIGSIRHPIRAAAGLLLDRFLEVAPGDPVRLLDDAVAYRGRQATLSAGEIRALDVAAARVKRPNT